MSRRTISRRAARSVATASAPAFGPSTYSGNVVYLVGDQGVTNSSTFTWADQSPNTKGNWTQSTTANKPTTTTINGVAAVSFPGVNPSSISYLVGPSLSALTAAHAFVVVVPSIDGLAHGMWQFGVGAFSSEGYMPYSSGLVYETFATTVRKTTGYTLTAGVQVLEFISTSTEWTMKVNGTQVYTTATNTVGFNATGTVLGGTTSSDTTAANASYPFNGKLGAVLVYNSKQSTGNAAAIVSALRSKFSF